MDKNMKEKIQKYLEFINSDANKPFINLAIDKSGKPILDANGSPLIRHSFTGETKEINEAEWSVTHLISTPRIDYVHDVMNPFGCDDKALQKNRGVFYNHQFSGPRDLPIGKNVWLKPMRTGILCKTVYAGADYQFAADVFNLVKGGFLNSYSIGFKYGEFDIVTIESLLKLIDNAFDIPNINEFSPDTQVWYHSGWFMHEYSQVGVPMNMDAVVQAQFRKALDDGTIKSDLGKACFGKLAEPAHVTIPDEPEQKENPPTVDERVKSVEEKIQALETRIDGFAGVIEQLQSLVEEEDDPEDDSGKGTKESDPVEKAGEQTTDYDPMSLINQVASGAISGVTGSN